MFNVLPCVTVIGKVTTYGLLATVQVVFVVISASIVVEADAEKGEINNVKNNIETLKTEYFILSISGTMKEVKVPTLLITKQLLEAGKSIKEIAHIRNFVFTTILQHVEDIMHEYPETIITHIRPDNQHIELVKKANAKLADEKKGKLSALKAILEKQKHDLSFDDIRLARLFI